MRNNLFRKPIISTYIIVLLFSIQGVSQENDVSNYKMSFKFNTTKQHDNSRSLEVSFIGIHKKNRKDKIPIYDAEIKFFNILNNDEILLGASETSKKGIAQIILPEDHTYLIDDEGNINLAARFDGNDLISKQEKEIRVKDLHMELFFTDIDSIKTVLVKAFVIDTSGSKYPITETEIIISMGSMLSKMKLEEGTIEDGEFEFDFPTDIPGDVNGNLTVYSIIEDHDEFANVIQMGSVNWGVFKKQIKEEKNMLWSHAAPTWMYIVLTIMLVGVWANYIYTIINLIKIRKEGDDIGSESAT
jgi:hypothetical protein